MTLNTVARILAIVVFAIVAVIDIGNLATVPHELAWIAAALALFAASFLP